MTTYQLTADKTIDETATIDMQLLAKTITEVIKGNLPSEYCFDVWIRKGCFGNEYVAFSIMSSRREINNVRGQYPEHISMQVSDDLELRFQGFGGMGGRRIYRKIDTNNPKEKYLALGSEAISFRKPKKEIEAIKRSIAKVCERYDAVIKDIEQRGLRVTN